MIELNSLPVSRPPAVLAPNTLMEGYWHLIDHAEVLLLAATQRRRELLD